SVKDPAKDCENKFRDIVKNQFDFEFFDLRLKFACFQSFPELSFEDGEYGFDLVSLMVPDLVEGCSEFSSIDTKYPFSFSRPDRDKRVRVQVITDQSVNIF